MAFSRPEQPEIPELDPVLNTVLKPTTIDLVGGIFCHVCQLILRNKKEYDIHFISHESGDTDIVYTCVVCRKPFTSYAIFRNHCYIKHVIKDKFRCQHCGKYYSKQIVLSNHIKTVHDIECGICDERFTSKVALIAHQIMHKKSDDNLPYLCNSCGEKIYTVDTCEQHIDEISIIKFPCPICDDILLTKADAAKHVATHFNKTITDIMDANFSEEPQYTEDSSIDFLGLLCCYCNMILKNRTEIDLHILNEHSDKEIVYTCNICHKKYESDKYNTFVGHCYFHLTRNKFECTECGKTFPRLSLYVMHTEAYHSYAGSAECANRDEHKPFECMLCFHAFKTSRGLIRHLHQDHGERVMQCPEDGCGKFFESLKELILHQRVHNSISKNSCRFCGLQFTSLAACVNHVEVHRIKHYGCPICNKEYKEKYMLVKHIPAHFEGVLHICKVCGKSYNAKGRLIQHSKIHTEARTYKCTYCGKGFFTASTLQQHLNIHTGMRPYKCMVCDKTFAAHPNWSKHLRRMHEIDVKKLKIDAKEHQVDTIPKKVKADTTGKTTNNHKVKPMEISRIDSTSSEVSMEPSLLESDDSTMDSVASSTLERELEIIANNISNLDGDLSELLSPSEAIFTDSDSYIAPPQPPQPAAIPTELGPDFVNTDIYNPNGAYINLDENIMPHIDPLLTIKQENGQNENANYSYINIDTNIDCSINNNIDNNVICVPSVTCFYPDLYREGMTGANMLTVVKTDMY